MCGVISGRRYIKRRSCVQKTKTRGTQGSPKLRYQCGSIVTKISDINIKRITGYGNRAQCSAIRYEISI
jgi:hypothetical protein